MKCAYCGAAFPENSTICVSCGKNVGETGQPAKAAIIPESGNGQFQGGQNSDYKKNLSEKLHETAKRYNEVKHAYEESKSTLSELKQKNSKVPKAIHIIALFVAMYIGYEITYARYSDVVTVVVVFILLAVVEIVCTVIASVREKKISACIKREKQRENNFKVEMEGIKKECDSQQLLMNEVQKYL